MNLKSAPVTMLLGAVSLALVALLGWFLLIGPTLGDLGAVGERKTEAEDRSALMSVQLATLRSQAEGLPATRQEADRLALVFPPTADQPGFFAQVNDAARDAGIPSEAILDMNHEAPVVPGEDEAQETGQSLTVPDAVADSDVALQVVTVAVKGRYDRLSRVLANLESMRRTLFVTSVDVSEMEGGDDVRASRAVLKLTVTGVTFVAPPLEAPEAEQPAGGPSDSGDEGGDEGGNGGGNGDDDTQQASG